MNRARQLYELQEIDLDIGQRRGALRAVESQLGRDDVLIQARAALAEEGRYLVGLERAQQAVEWEVEDLEARIASSEKKLYGGSVTNPKELLSLQLDVEHIKARRGEREGHFLDVMMQVEAARHSLEAKRSEMVVMESEWREAQQQLAGEQAQLKTELEALEQRRGAIAGQIDRANIELYEALRQAKAERAVAKVEQGKCQGCRLSLSTAQIQQTRVGQELVQCSNCGRILYLG